MSQNKHPAETAKDFRQYAFFSGFSEELLLQVCTMTQWKQFKKGDTILEQGKVNDFLYFLASGEVEIIVENEFITRLTKPGEVLGEMSVISRQPASATLVAATAVDVYGIDSKEFDFVAQKDRAQFQFLIYKIYASILTERLRSTNFKARQAEISNRDLIKVQDELKKMNANLELLVEERTSEVRRKAEQLENSHLILENQNAALTAGFKKLSDQAQIRDTTVAKVKNLDSTYLKPLHKTLSHIHDELNDSQHASELHIALEEVQGISEQIKSLLDFFQSEKSMEHQRVLLVDPEKKQQLVAKMALGGTGVNLDIAGDLDTAKAQLQAGKYDLVACDIAMEEFMKFVHDSGAKVPIVAFTNTEVASYLDKLQRLPFVSHVVSRDATDRNFTTKTILTTINKILNRDFFGLEKYLAWGVDVQEVKILNSGERTQHIEKMQESFKKIGVRSSLLGHCGVVAEEMLMNAIYDAPTDAKGQPLFNHQARTQAVALSSDQAATLRYACDGNLIAISVSDPFGGLPKKIIFDYLETCYKGEAGHLNEGKGGAGRGLHQIIEHSGLTVFNVQNKIKTEVICLIDTDPTAKKDSSNPNFHYFYF